MVPPKSHSTTSPASITRDAGLVVGRRGVGAGGDDGEVDLVVALGEQPATDVGGHLGLGAAHQGDVALRAAGRPPGRRPRRRRAGRRPRRRPWPSAAGRRPRSRGATRSTPAAPPAGRRRSGPRCGRRWRPSPAEAGQAGDDGDGVVGLLPRAEGEHLGALDDPGRLQAGHDQRGVALARHHEHREPLERHGLVAGEPRQVGPDRQQERRRRRPRPSGPGCGRAGRRTSSRLDPDRRQPVERHHVLLRPVRLDAVGATCARPSRAACRARST